MKRLFLTFVVLTLAITSWAYSVKFDFTTGYANNQRIDNVTNGGVTITFHQGQSTNWAQWLESSQCLRMYAKNGFTVKASDNVEQFIIYFKSSDKRFVTGTNAQPTLSSGTYSESGVQGVWTGEAQSVTLTAGGTKGHARIDSIKVTVKGEAPGGSVTNPVISPASASFSDSQVVTISCDDNDAEIRYTLDETTPDANSSLYTGPITLTETTTVKAIAIKEDAVSQVVTAKFTLVVGINESIAEFLAQPDGTTMVFNFPVTVVYQYEKHLFVQDYWGLGMRIFGNTGQTYNPGDIIPAGFTGRMATYGGEPELDVFYTDNFKVAEGKNALLATAIDALDISSLYHADYVVVRDVQLGKGDTDEDFFMYNRDEDYGQGFLGTFKTIKLPEDLAPRYDVVGVVSSHYTLSTIYQLLPIEFYIHGDLNNDKSINVGDIATLYQSIMNPSVYPTAGSALYVGDIRGDLTEDGSINVGDIATLYKLILKN